MLIDFVHKFHPPPTLLPLTRYLQTMGSVSPDVHLTIYSAQMKMMKTLNSPTYGEPQYLDEAYDGTQLELTTDETKLEDVIYRDLDDSPI